MQLLCFLRETPRKNGGSCLSAAWRSFLVSSKFLTSAPLCLLTGCDPWLLLLLHPVSLCQQEFFGWFLLAFCGWTSRPLLPCGCIMVFLELFFRCLLPAFGEVRIKTQKSDKCPLWLQCIHTFLLLYSERALSESSLSTYRNYFHFIFRLWQTYRQLFLKNKLFSSTLKIGRMLSINIPLSGRVRPEAWVHLAWVLASWVLHVHLNIRDVFFPWYFSARVCVQGTDITDTCDTWLLKSLSNFSWKRFLEVTQSDHLHMV